MVNLISGIVGRLFAAPAISRTMADRVDAAIVEIETTKGGAVHPIRSIPIDMIADVIAREVGNDPPDADFRASLAGVLVRFDPPRQAAASTLM